MTDPLDPDAAARASRASRWGGPTCAIRAASRTPARQVAAGATGPVGA